MEGNMHTVSSGVACQGFGSMGVQPEGANSFWGVIKIKAGEGIGENIQSYFENRENFPSGCKERTCLGTILLCQGTIYSPTVNTEGSVPLYEGSCPLASLFGLYFIPKDGPVQLHGSLRMICDTSDGKHFGGFVSGSPIAAEPIQVTVLGFTIEDPDLIRFFQTTKM